jgi:hypothetical protein
MFVWNVRWYEVFVGMKCVLVWSLCWYEGYVGMKCVLAWSLCWYEGYVGMKFSPCFDDGNSILNFVKTFYIHPVWQYARRTLEDGSVHFRTSLFPVHAQSVAGAWNRQAMSFTGCMCWQHHLCFIICGLHEKLESEMDPLRRLEKLVAWEQITANAWSVQRASRHAFIFRGAACMCPVQLARLGDVILLKSEVNINNL